MVDLRVVCTGGGAWKKHPAAELGMFVWTPEERDENGVGVWEPSASLRDLVCEPVGEVARPTRGGASRHRVQRVEVESERRTDGGTTWLLPACPRCGRPPVTVRDSTLRRYGDSVRNTPLAGVLDVAHVGRV